MTPSVILEAVADLLETEATTLRLVAENTESRSVEIRVQSILNKIDRLERQKDRLRQLIGSIKDRERRRHDLEKRRRQNDTSSDKTNEAKTTPAKLSFNDRVIRDERGRVLALRLRIGSQDLFLTAGGKLIGREWDGKTYDAKGIFRGYGSQALRLVKRSQYSGKPAQNGRHR